MWTGTVMSTPGFELDCTVLASRVELKAGTLGWEVMGSESRSEMERHSETGVERATSLELDPGPTGAI